MNDSTKSNLTKEIPLLLVTVTILILWGVEMPQWLYPNIETNSKGLHFLFSNEWISIGNGIWVFWKDDVLALSLNFTKFSTGILILSTIFSLISAVIKKSEKRLVLDVLLYVMGWILIAGLVNVAFALFVQI
ncbi:hypothetical protein P8881_19530 [Bacillus haynesii]|uniref:hypothetical protein n=1 Tax=Bacillus haynesii TaxID=1925021 RepID=UPI00227F03BF|nr:hypothetical protein [Bacillus haynesii]MCY8737527.1 hypothetical protein [Bacillus haynesii]MEC0709718.1 hypothetical protein [Bacillus haynesii]MEC0736903.1 hypothetical protein [Bacillus haynesii]